MFRIFGLILFLFSLNLSLSAQSEIELKLSTVYDTIVFGEEVKLKLSLFGIEGNIFENSTTTKESIFSKMFDTPPKRDSSFSMKISVKPEKTGMNIIGPYEIVLFDRKVVSNSINVFVEERKASVVKFSIPEQIKTNELVEIKYSGTAMNYNVSLEASDFYEGKGIVKRSTFINGKMSNTFILKLVFLKKGTYTLTKNWFKGLPDEVIIEPIEIEVQKGKKKYKEAQKEEKKESSFWKE